MAISKTLKTGLNALHEVTSEIYHKYVPIIEDDTDISVFANPILTMDVVKNEFIGALINRIVYTGFTTKRFNNPLKVLEGERLPLGYAGQEVYTNPARGRQFNGEDFAGLLFKYESDVKVQYMTLNMDTQYPVTLGRQALKKAFTSWSDLETFIEQLTNSLYNGAFIDEYRFTKNLISASYKDNKAIITTIDAPTTEEKAKEFITKARALFLNFQSPSSKYNAWNKCGGSGRPIVTWTDPEDIVFIVRNDIRAYMDVNVLASAFNMDKATLLGNIVTVDNFDIYNDEGARIYDGSNIYGMIADKSWFKIKTQDMFMESFYNPNNRTMQYYLNMIKMYQFSLFANGVIFASSVPEVPVTNISFNATTIEVETGSYEGLEIIVTPSNATTPIEFTIDSEGADYVSVEKVSDRECVVRGKAEGTATLTATAGSVTAEVEVQVADAE